MTTFGKKELKANLRVSHEHEGMRLDQVLVAIFTDFSRAYFQRFIRDGCILLNGRPTRQADTVHTNDLIEIDCSPKDEIELEPEEVPFEVLAEDERILVINKPPGVVVHPAKYSRRGTLVHGLLHYDEDSFGGLVDEELRPGIVHRLDKDTSGVMVVAKDNEARQVLKDAFRDRLVEKTYLAIVVGEFGVVTGEIRTLIGRNPGNRMQMGVVKDKGKPAVTKYRVLQYAGGLTLIEVKIETGRTHQIRVHFAHLRHPVLGDKLYGRTQCDLPVVAKRQMLHAWKLAFPHPATGRIREYMATPPPDFQQILIDCGMSPLAGYRSEF